MENMALYGQISFQDVKSLTHTISVSKHNWVMVVPLVCSRRLAFVSLLKNLLRSF